MTDNIPKEMQEDMRWVGEAAQKDQLDPPEALACKLMDIWIANHGYKITWQKAVQISAIVCKMPDAERDKLLNM